MSNLEEIERWIDVTREQLAADQMHPGVRQECNRALDALKDMLGRLEAEMWDSHFSDATNSSMFSEAMYEILAILNGEAEGKPE